MASSGSRSQQYIYIASIIGAVLGILNIIATAFLTFLLFMASASLPGDTAGLGFIWLIVFVMWGYAIAMTWAAYAVRKGSKAGWVVLVVMLGLASLSFLFTPQAGLYGIAGVRVAFGLAAITGFVLLIVPPSFRWIWSPPEPSPMLYGYGSPGVGRGGWGVSAPQPYPSTPGGPASAPQAPPSIAYQAPQPPQAPAIPYQAPQAPQPQPPAPPTIPYQAPQPQPPAPPQPPQPPQPPA